MRAIAKLNGFRFLKMSAALCLALSGFGCATEALSQRGSTVEMAQEVDKTCKNLGPVVGKGGGSFGGAWISDEDLIQYATNDLRNKAAEKGATHVIFDSHQMGNTSGKDGGTTSTATIMGIAYWCPPNVAPSPAQQAAAAPAPSPAAALAPLANPQPAATAAAPAPAPAPQQ